MITLVIRYKKIVFSLDYRFNLLLLFFFGFKKIKIRKVVIFCLNRKAKKKFERLNIRLTVSVSAPLLI